MGKMRPETYRKEFWETYLEGLVKKKKLIYRTRPVRLRKKIEKVKWGLEELKKTWPHETRLEELG
jgi:hypothetical protein